MRLKAFILCIFLAGCDLPIPSGGHGLIKGYRYQTTKDKLEKVVMDVIKNNTNIFRDTTVNYIHYLDANTGKYEKDSTADNYYNDGINYVTIKIKATDIENEYTFRFYGDTAYWKTSPSSEIFICYAYDKNGKGGSEGNGGVDHNLRNKLTVFFESVFVNKIDKELNLKHIEDNGHW